MDLFQVAGKWRIMERIVPTPRHTALIIIQHHPTKSADILKAQFLEQRWVLLVHDAHLLFVIPLFEAFGTKHEILFFFHILTFRHILARSVDRFQFMLKVLLHKMVIDAQLVFVEKLEEFHLIFVVFVSQFAFLQFDRVHFVLFLVPFTALIAVVIAHLLLVVVVVIVLLLLFRLFTAAFIDLLFAFHILAVLIATMSILLALRAILKHFILAIAQLLQQRVCAL
mmetsp:Transcript_60736/g.96501  ORF Transcript_60736/g.96501 Transcript_60736/m.96501 type:complete len:225 (-) Transcript_60736:460-1134(-)